MTHQRFNLRPYQKDCINSINKKFETGNECLIQLGTGAGKSVIFSEYITTFPGRVLILTNKVKLVEQAARYFDDYGIYCATIGKKDKTKRITIASIQSVKGSIDYYDLIVVDEVHAFNMDRLASYNYGKLLGCTATPFMGSGQFIYGPDKLFKNIDYKKPFGELTKEGWLVPIILRDGGQKKFNTRKIKTNRDDYVLRELNNFVMSDMAKVKAQVDDAVEKSAFRNKVAFICCSIEHAETVFNFLPEDSAVITHSKTDTCLHDFEHGTKKYLVSVLQITTGYDFPPLDCLVLMRPTRSPVLYCQVVGRIARLHPSKDDGLLLDYGRVVENLGMIYNVQLRSKDGSVRLCPICETYSPLKIKICGCGHEFTRFCGGCGKLIKLGDKCCVKPVHKSIVSKQMTLESFTDKDWFKTDSLLVEWHTSKRGNRCVKVSYYLGVQFIISEYFLEFQKIKMKEFVREDIVNLNDFYYKAKTCVKPKKILIGKDGKFKTVLARSIQE